MRLELVRQHEAVPSSPDTVLVVPDEFVAEVADGGDVALRWINSLPGLVADLAVKWDVKLELGSPRFGANALVVLGDRRGERCALKASRPDHSIRSEAEGLRVWDGSGAVRLLEWSSKDNVLLLEALDPDRSLEAVPLDTAAEVVGLLTRRLAVPAPEGFVGALEFGESTQAYLSKQSELGAPLPDEWVALATRVLDDLLRTMSRMLVPSDLHAGNVLAARREPWLAIDPRPVVGDPEISIADLLLWHLPLDAPLADVTSLVETMVTAADLDPLRARGWTIVRAVSRWLWCCDADADLPPDAARCSVCAPRCTRILEALI
jgi:streptomycin 6-kinase